jgi:hypothetical protein
MSDAAFLDSLRAAERDAVAELALWRERVLRGETLLKSIRDCIAAYEGDGLPQTPAAESMFISEPSNVGGKTNTATIEPSAALVGITIPAALQPAPAPLDEAQTFAALMASDPVKWTTAEIARVKQTSVRYVEKRLALLKLPAEEKENLRAGSIKLTEAQGIVTVPKRAIAPTLVKVWRAVAEYISKTGLSPQQREIATTTGVHFVDVSQAIRKLEHLGYLRRVGSAAYAVMHVEKWPDGIEPRPTTGRADGRVHVADRPKAEKRHSHPSSAGGKPARRFDHADFDPTAVMALRPDHPALKERRTLFPTTVTASADSNRLLVSGANQRKLGDRVTKGTWRGMPIFALTLEERKTCPTSCFNWSTCYGNGMQFSRRHKVDAGFWPKMHAELGQLQKEFPAGFVVRLHVLGDFPDVEYVRKWEAALDTYPALHIFGYTAWLPNTNIGFAIEAVAKVRWGRFAIRFSAAKSRAGGATTITRRARGRIPEGIVCPAQTEENVCCGSCGLCWAETAKNETIVFMMHGRSTGRVGRPIGSAPSAPIAAPVPKPAVVVTKPAAAAIAVCKPAVVAAPKPRATRVAKRKAKKALTVLRPAGTDANEWIDTVLATIDRLGTRATYTAIANKLGTGVQRVSPTISKLLTDRRLILVDWTDETTYLAVMGSKHDPHHLLHRDTELMAAVEVCRKDGDDVVMQSNKREWRVNGRETLDRIGLIARGTRIAEKRRILAKGRV